MKVKLGICIHLSFYQEILILCVVFVAFLSATNIVHDMKSARCPDSTHIDRRWSVFSLDFMVVCANVCQYGHI